MSFRINRVYTRSGDKGETGLVGGKRVSKACEQVSAYGDVDELNATIGLAKAWLTPRCREIDALLEYLQQELFDVGSELATPPGETYEGMWRAKAENVEHLERLCDHYGKNLPELKSFILPGGSTLAAALHMARTVARRAERTIVAYREKLEKEGRAEVFNPELIRYINRVSDLLFILARWCLEQEGKTSPLWAQQAQRKPLI